ncbi:hypothetical protein AB833_13770 [Chromatiales bacterium (ex Bugula neritina AB1)]|nr:hypothetical protein AB833_13770 [Chromatiales bacterium (ex Bugula neritina AB1)]
MKTTPSHTMRKAKITNLVMIVLWLFSSTAVFFSPVHAQAPFLAHDVADGSDHSTHTIGENGSDHATGHKQHPCHNQQKQPAQIHADAAMHAAHSADAASDCELKCAMTRCGSCVSLLTQASFVNTALKHETHRPLPQQNLPHLPPDSIYRPPSI